MGIINKLFNTGNKKSATRDEDSWVDIARDGNQHWDELAQLKQYEKSIYVYRCVRLIAENVANVGYGLHRVKNTKGETEEVSNHPLLSLLAKPNSFQTWSQFVKITEINKLLTGQAFWYKIFDKRGKLVEMWNIRPDLMRPITDKHEYIKGYEMRVDGQMVYFGTHEIVQFTSPNPIAPWSGQSPLAPAKSRILTEQYAGEYQRDFFNNSARPDALIISETALSGEQKEDMRRKWNDNFQGRGKTSQIGFLSGNIKYQQVTQTQKEMDYIETMKFTRDDILVAFGVPRGLIVTEDSNNADGQNAFKSFLANTISPEVNELFETVNEMLVSPDYGNEYYLQQDEVVPDDRKALIEEFTAGVDKWITRNEARQQLGLEPMDGGNTLYTEFGKIDINSPLTYSNQSNTERGIKLLQARPEFYNKLKTIEDTTELVQNAIKSAKKKYKAKVKSKATKKKKDDDTPTTQSLFGDKARRNQYEAYVNKSIDKRAKDFRAKLEIEFARQKESILEKLEGILIRDENSPESIANTLDIKGEVKRFKDNMYPTYVNITEDAGKQAMRIIDGKKTVEDFVATQVLLNLLDDRAIFFAESVNKTTFEGITQIIVDGISNGDGRNEVADKIEARYEEIDTVRADLIARTETTYANNTGYQEAYEQSSVVNGKEWIATHDGRTRATHMAVDGEIVENYQTFSNGQDHPNEPNCRCVIAPALITK